MSESNASIKEQVSELVEQIRLGVQMDGGDVQLIDVSDDGIVSVQLLGACVGCPLSTFTLKAGIERMIRSRIPEVKAVVMV